MKGKMVCWMQHGTDSRLFPSSFNLMRVGAALSLLFGFGSTLSCHCLNNFPCTNSGTCTFGCERGWYGPGCQLGNLAFRKRAAQSSTYLQFSADLAVNGEKPQLEDFTEEQCSHTEETRSQPVWWYVTLSDSEDFVIKNVTIVNRQGPSAKYLRLFTILYTTSVSDNPDPNTWKRFSHQESAPSTLETTFTSEGNTAIGRRVAIYIGSQPDVQMLILCEVYVDGFPYNEAPSLRENRFSVSSTCNSIKVIFETTPVIPPSFFSVQLQPADGNSPTITERFRYPSKTNPTAILLAMSSRTYNIFIIPETCCIGSYCLNDIDERNITTSQCFEGTRSRAFTATTLNYERYSLSLTGNAVNVVPLNVSLCLAIDFNIQCTSLSSDVSVSTNCHSNSCQLNPFYNYQCQLRMNFTDGSTQVNSAFIAIDAANFTSYDVSATAACYTIYVELQNVTQSWSFNPNFIVFFKKSLADNMTTEVQKPFGNSENYSAAIPAAANSEYLVWASPEYCWLRSKCSNNSDRACFDSAKCAVGRGTLAKLITTKPRKYSLQVRECCLSLEDESSEKCNNPDNVQIACTDKWNFMYKSSGGFESGFCGYTGFSNYTCQIEAEVDHFTVMKTIYHVTNVSQSKCTAQMQQQRTIIIAGSSVGIAVMVAIFVAVGWWLRRRAHGKQADQGKKTTKTRTAESTNHAFSEEQPVYDDTLATPNQEEKSYGSEGATDNATCDDKTSVEYHEVDEEPQPQDVESGSLQHEVGSSDFPMQKRSFTTEQSNSYADYRQNVLPSGNKYKEKPVRGPYTREGLRSQTKADQADDNMYRNVPELPSLKKSTSATDDEQNIDPSDYCVPFTPQGQTGVSYVNAYSRRRSDATAFMPSRLQVFGFEFKKP